MYQVMGNIYEIDVPLVFKGAMVVRNILLSKGYGSIDRPTGDIDSHWTGSPPSMETLVALVQKALAKADDGLISVPFREYSDNKSAGIYVLDAATNEKLFSMDINVRPVDGSQIYTFGDIAFRGVLPTSIISDKVMAMSTNYVFRRAKDMVDVYALTHCIETWTADIFELIKRHPEKRFERYEGFYNRKPELEHAYAKLNMEAGKPPFEVIYPYIERFIRPFAQRDETPRVWYARGEAWNNAPARELEIQKPGVFEKLAAAKTQHADIESKKTPVPKDGPERGDSR
jgi:hypothetical protein